MDDTPSPAERGLLLDDSNLPLYQQVAHRLTTDLTAEGGARGARIPAERTLAERYDVSRVTVRAALESMRDLGLLERAQPRGWLLSSRWDRLGSGQVLGFTENARRSGLRASSRVLSARVRPADVPEAEIFSIAPGSPLFEMRRLRHLDGLVIASEHNRLPLAICPALAETDFERASLYDTLRASTPPVHPSQAEYEVVSRHSTPEEAELLGSSDAIPLLVATQRTWDRHVTPVEYTTQAYRGDRYTFRGTITD